MIARGPDNPSVVQSVEKCPLTYFITYKPKVPPHPPSVAFTPPPTIYLVFHLSL